ncbi:serine protease inhibitor 77Ba-like [Contarinia nasturtii]|uniref:serine protease inhibitor 77Ba-like n=1 Tax=Contarinia nasturtii TaxID=265458 RepID=UPI0012D3EAE8|nr:serine protease inhibitor 77Ba-like [Contarinia nasturtii]
MKILLLFLVCSFIGDSITEPYRHLNAQDLDPSRNEYLHIILYIPEIRRSPESVSPTENSRLYRYRENDENTGIDPYRTNNHQLRLNYNQQRTEGRFPSSAQGNYFQTSTKAPLTTTAQNVPDNKAARTVDYKVSQGSQKFMIGLFSKTADTFRNQNANFMVAPFSIWSLMLLLAEGATGQSFDQLKEALGIPQNLTELRNTYGHIERTLTGSSAIELEMSQAVIYDTNRPIIPEYRQVVESEYKADLLPVNFVNTREAAKVVNEHIRLKTHDKIQNFLEPSDLTDVQLLLASVNFFKGKWKFPFLIERTVEEEFFRDGGESVGKVPMMVQRSFLPSAMINDLRASVLELPYGDDGQICMWLILPYYDTTSSAILEKLNNYDVAKINHALHKFDGNADYEPSEVVLSLPRFKIESNFDLTEVLKQLGISHVFDSAKANLPKISKEFPHISRISHKAVIDVNEAGTIAAAVAGATVSFKQLPIEFKFNHAFNFMIVDRSTNTLLFAGQVQDPLK